jgi:hypothetical protein
VTIKSLLEKYPCVVSIDSLQGIISSNLEKPWDTDSVSKQIVLPSNYEELVANNYLIRLVLHVLMEQEYTIIVGNSEWNSRLTWSAESNYFMQAVGLVILSEEPVNLPNSKGILWKGIASAMKTWIQGQKGMDLSLSKVATAPGIVQHILGDTWTNYPKEKKLLDFVVHYIRVMPMPRCNLKSVILPKEKITLNKGLDFSLKSDLVSTVEKEFIELVLDKRYHIKESQDYLDISRMENRLTWSALQEGITERQKSIREPKDLFKNVVSDRVKSCFDPYKGNARKKAAKKPIRSLITEIKGTESFTAFNPSIWFTLIKGCTKLPDKRSTFANEEMQVNLISQTEYVLIGALGETPIITNILLEYTQYLKDQMEE